MLQDRFVDVGPIRTRCWQAGTSGSAVVLVHGIGCSVLEWERNIEALALHHRVVALDLLGFGLTDKPADETYSLENLARFVLDFMAVAGIDRAHLCGNSLGGRLALLCAALAPARVSSTLLVDPAGVDLGKPLFEFRVATLPVLGELATYPTRLGTRMIWRQAFYDPAPFVTPEMIDMKVRMASQAGAQSAFLKTLRGFVELGGFSAGPVAACQASMPDIGAPSLVLWGANDRFVPVSHAQVLRQKLPDVEVQVWEHCGHVPQIEYAERFNDTALAFWRRVDASATAAGAR